MTQHLPLVRLGTRASTLALAQSGQMARRLEEAHPSLRVELVPMSTLGDRTKGSLAPVGGKGLFTAELEQGLLAGDLDLAVHSLKDVPVQRPDGLELTAFPQRANPRDALISEVATSIADLPPGAVVLTGALRRRAQLLALRPDLDVQDLRGNVDTRIRRWRESGAAAVLLASAGLERLGEEGLDLASLPIHQLDPEVFVPAPGQGILALETAIGGPAQALVAALDDPATRQEAEAERHVVGRFGGHCALPLAAWARSQWIGDAESNKSDQSDQAEQSDRTDVRSAVSLTGLVASPDGLQVARAESQGATALEAAEACIELLRQRGAEEILAAIPNPRPESSGASH